MLRAASFICLLLLLCALSVQAEQDTSPGPILVIGDSLSADYGFDRAQGWVNLLEARLDERGESRGVVNAAISGDTTRSGRARIAAALERHEPSLVIIQLGGNDGLRGLPVEETAANLRQMIAASQAAGARVLLVGVRMPPNYGRRFTEAFADMYRTVAADTGVVLVPRILEGVAERENLMQADGIHPTAEAQPLILDNLWPAIEGLLETN
ncbi:arylesterase [Natronospira bacteriovora]|uniref:Arylesterase n=1 Tax=Natronospira bacteriovora TaxID=3069753 RepID=A0ABU0W865_9GAMM|nr:arylesterase [Natronospira sp. AB-CW4]MDQ2070220.1 arylesterase [Natronospira sp. AB-CW4]